MSKKQIVISKEYLSQACDIVGKALDECAERTLSEHGLDKIAKIVTRDYKDLLLKAIFEEGEENE